MMQDEARLLATRLLGSSREIALHPFEFGWLAEQIPTDEDRREWRQIGQGYLIVDRSGVVTSHPSLPARVVMADYTEARRDGRITGRQIWPEEEITPNLA